MLAHRPRPLLAALALQGTEGFWRFRDTLFQRQRALTHVEVDRHRFQGEVLVIAGLEDVVFSPVVAEALAREYPNSRFVAPPK